MHKKLAVIFLSCFFIILFCAIAFFAQAKKEKLEIDFLDVGMGDGILIKTPFNQNILIDGGPDNAILRRLGENMPFFDRTIDLMILSHPHDDHLVGQVEVLKRYKVNQIIYTGAENNSPAYDEWKALVQENNIPVIIIDRPQKIILGPECELEVLYPDENFSGRGMENINNSSIVARLVYKNNKFLFVGDAETEIEKKVLSKKLDLAADVLKVAHHASDTATSEDFLEKVKPKIAIISVNKNDFGLPSIRVLKRLERHSVKVYQTDQNGTIKIASDGQNLEVK